MSVLWIVLPLALILGGAGVAAFLWMARTGQFDDLESPQIRMLFDDETQPDPSEREDGKK